VTPAASGVRQTRTCTRHVTDRSCQGRSLNVRQYRLCTRAEARPQTRQDAWAAVVRAVISNPVSSSVRSSTCRPSGTDGIDGFEIGIALPSGHHAIQRPNHRSAPKVRKNLNFDPLDGPGLAIPAQPGEGPGRGDRGGGGLRPRRPVDGAQVRHGRPQERPPSRRRGPRPGPDPPVALEAPGDDPGHPPEPVARPARATMARLVRNSQGQYAKRSVPSRWGVYKGEVRLGGSHLMGYIARPGSARQSPTPAPRRASSPTDGAR